MLAEKKAPQQVSAAMLIPFRRERARALRVLALAALTTTTAPQGTTRRCADEQPSPTPCDSHANALPPMLPPPHPTPMQHLVLLSLHAAPAGQQQVHSSSTAVGSRVPIERPLLDKRPLFV